MALIRTSLQVVAATAIVIILFILGYSVFNREAVRSMREAQQLRNKLDVFTGVKDMAMMQGESYSTVDENSPMFLNLKPSVNQAGGIEYTYNFWLYKDAGIQTPPPLNTDSPAVPVDNGLQPNDIVLLLRGVDKPVTYKNVCGNDKVDIYVKSPLIKLENYGDSLTVEFNTKKAVDVVREGARNRCTDSSTDWNEVNSHKVSVRSLSQHANFDKQWFMVTVVLQDTYPADPLPFRNRVRVLIYINGVLELDQYVDNKLDQTDLDPSILKPNEGNLYVMPQIVLPVVNGTTTIRKTFKPNKNDIQKIMMADLSYYNYAVERDDVVSIYEKGFNKFYATPPSGSDPSQDIFKSMSYTDGKKRQLTST